MLTVYAICFVGGGLLIALSILRGGDVDADDGVEVDLRGVIFGTAFFGMTGALFTLLGVGRLLTLAFAVAWAVVAAASIQRLMGYLARSESGEMSPRALEGSTAEVIVDIDHDRVGKVAINRADRSRPDRGLAG